MTGTRRGPSFKDSHDVASRKEPVNSFSEKPLSHAPDGGFFAYGACDCNSSMLVAYSSGSGAIPDGCHLFQQKRIHMNKRRLFGRLPSHHKFACPITVIVERADGGYLVYEQHTVTYASGPTRGEALAQYKRLLVADLRMLSNEERHLSSHLRLELNYLRQIVTWR